MNVTAVKIFKPGPKGDYTWVLEITGLIESKLPDEHQASFIEIGFAPDRKVWNSIVSYDSEDIANTSNLYNDIKNTLLEELNK